MNPTGAASNPANMAKPLADKVALVTGGTRGIGKAIAQKLASLGANVSICGRNEDVLLQRTAKEIESRGVRVHAQKADVSRNSDVTALVQATEKELGPISILVDDGVGMFGPVYEKTEED